MRRLLPLFITIAVGTGLGADGQVVFRSNADEVLVDVSVMRGQSPVAGLTVADFVVTDNGVRQSIRDVSLNTTDSDVTLVIQREGVLSNLVVDPGGRSLRIRTLTAGPAIDSAVAHVRRLLQPADSLRVIGADQDGRSSILDGLTAAMMLKPSAVGRRQLIVGITGGTDDQSFVPAASRVNVAMRTDAVVHIIAVGEGRASYILSGDSGWKASQSGVAAAPLKEIAEPTGGRLYQVEPGSNVEQTLGPALEEFRTRYLLRYVPSGVSRAGWHDIVVTVPSGAFEVRHRRGYEVR